MFRGIKRAAGKFIKRHKAAFCTALMVCVLTVPALATSGESTTADMSTITSAVSTGLASVQSNAMSLIGTVLPYALTVMGSVLVVSIGVHVFKKVTGK